MQEEWKGIPGHYPYVVSSYGTVVNSHTDRVLAQHLNQQGIVSVLLSHNLQKTRLAVGVLVARTFLPSGEFAHFDTPINLDGDRRNNRADNLMWRPRWFAVRYHQQFRRPIVVQSPVEELMEGIIYENSRHAAVSLGLLETEIAKSAIEQGRREVFPGRKLFRFAEN